MVFGQWSNSLESVDLPVDQNGITYEDMVETLFTCVKPVDDNNEIVEIQSVEEPIYMQELAEQITVEKDKEDVIVDVEYVEDTTSVHKIIDGSCGKKWNVLL